MYLEFIELEIQWPLEVSIYDLKYLVLSKLAEYGDPLRWAITSINSISEDKPQMILVEAVLVINQDKEKFIHTN